MKEKEIEDELVSIRSMMERSSKFISLSGLSGVLAGVYALIGAWGAYYLMYGRRNSRPYYTDPEVGVILLNVQVARLVTIAILVLLASLITGFILSSRKAKRKGQKIWSKTSRQLLFNMAVPLASGGALVLVHIYRGHYGLVAPSCLVFYGLSLVAASNFTFTDVKYLGLCEIILGLVAACLPGYGLLFWAIGFGLLHIVYGRMMYFKYDR